MPLALLSAVRRPAALAAQGVAVALIVGGTAAWAVDDTTVALSVDGEVQQVSTRGDTVADVLVEAGLDVGEHDLLAPAPGTRVEEGDRVSLRRARALTLVVDGVEQTVWVTAESVDEAMDQVGTIADGAKLSASRSRRIGLEGLTLEVRTPRDITVVHDGVTTPVRTTAIDVAAGLREAGVVLGPADRTSVPVQTPLSDGLSVQVVRIGSEAVVERVEIPFAVERRDDAGLTVGNERVASAGQPGVLVRTTTFVLADGVRVEPAVVETRESEPQAQVVAVGTKPKPLPPPPPAPRPPAAAPAASASSGGLSWGALARCESGGRPGAVSANGLYHGLYQFSDATWRGVGGSGSASQASADEQTARAKALYDRRGRSPWPQCGRYL